MQPGINALMTILSCCSFDAVVLALPGLTPTATAVVVTASPDIPSKGLQPRAPGPHLQAQETTSQSESTSTAASGKPLD
eukprot:CAMPEP_0172817572 /NCGR_PEP_ID=MMETSP1075-20121228/13300_1 /TAXON_ID=2916 /ORGANISM="Ceratium fusus, Strain PA161109" /LENGTH=78 /DNA_ID=CAMNT_0013657795 /DNA_START=308 /DNA_END=545 /DNA_ORIENTATION=+